MRVNEPAATGAAVDRPAPPQLSWGLVPAALMALAAFLLFGPQHLPSGYAALVISVVLGFALDRDLGRSLLLIGLSLAPIGAISLAADIWGHIALVAVVLLTAVAVPYVGDRLVFKRDTVGFPIRMTRRLSGGERAYLISVVVLAYLIMPFYFINSGTYLNWPAVREPSELIRLFIGVNAVGLWDELFFICCVFTLFRRHFPVWQANLLQAIIFVSFLWELGYQSWVPFLTFPLALVQGYLFNRTGSLLYVLGTHLIFDCVLWGVLVHAHTPEWVPIFLY